MRLKDKRGLRTAATVILIILAIVVIGGVIFLYSWSSGILLGEEKPNPISEQCAFFCDTNQKNGFCSFQVKASDSLTTTCDEFATNSAYSQYNVQTCPTISCTLIQEESDQTCISGLGGVWETPQQDGSCSQFGETIRRKLSPSDSPQVGGQICCV